MYLVRRGVVRLVWIVLIRKQVLRMGRQCNVNMTRTNIGS